MWAVNLYLGPFEITEQFVNQLKQVTSDNMTRWLITNIEFSQFQESGELVSISRSETNSLKLSIVLGIGL